MGGKFDKSFDEGGLNGAEKIQSETGISYLEFEVTQESAARAGHESAWPGVAPRSWWSVGLARSDPLEKIAKDYPDTKFADHRQRGRPAQRAIGDLQGA